jgi:chemotaxis family two-component system response regulator Rcp1
MLFNILLVEDNPADVQLAREAMKESSTPYSLKVVGNGEEAMSYLLSRDSDPGLERPDIILLDLNLPKKGGIEVLKEIKGNLDLKHIPIIVLTISHDEQDIESAYAVHANCYITKPVDFDKFSKVMKSIVNYWATVVKL